MSILSKLAGTLESFFQVGGTAGSGWNLNGAVLEAKNAANNALVIVRGLTPVGVTDLVTKAYADALAIAGDVTGTVAASTVTKVTGSAGVVNVAATGNVITWAAATTAPGLAQTAAVSGAGANTTIAPQAATTTGASGSLVVNVAAPASGTTEAALKFARAGTNLAWLQSVPSAPTYGGLFLGANTPTSTNYAIAGNSSTTYLAGSANINFSIGGNTQAQIIAGGIQLGYPAAAAFGGGSVVIGITNAATNPSTNPAGGVVLYSELTTGHLKNRGSLGAVTTLAPAGSSGTINSQKQLLDEQIGTCETVSSATPTAALAYATVSGTGGIMTITVVSRATTTGTGIAVGDTSVATYVLGYKNVAGTVTLSTAGITAVGSGQTTAAALTAPVLTATVATNVITILVTNVALCTVDSQVAANINAA